MRCVLDPRYSDLGFHFNRSHGNAILEPGFGNMVYAFIISQEMAYS